MMNKPTDLTALTKWMFLRYLATAFTHLYIIGFFVGDVIYCITLENLPEWIYKRSKDKSGFKVKFKDPDKINQKLLALGAKPIGTKADLRQDLINKGDAFEELIYRLNGQVWQGHNSVPYWQAGDIVINGKHHQVKFEYASLASFTTIENAPLK